MVFKPLSCFVIHFFWGYVLEQKTCFNFHCHALGNSNLCHMASTRGMPVVSGEDCPGVAKSLHQWPATRCRRTCRQMCVWDRWRGPWPTFTQWFVVAFLIQAGIESPCELQKYDKYPLVNPIAAAPQYTNAHVMCRKNVKVRWLFLGFCLPKAAGLACTVFRLRRT